MKKTIMILFCAALFSSCKKDVNACKDYKQLNGKEELIDVNTIDVPEFKAVLLQYPQLQAYRFKNESGFASMKCKAFYKGLPVFTDYYNVTKNSSSNQVYITDTVKTYHLAVSVEPGISYTDAIKESKKVMNFDHTCISYCLGIYNINAHSSYSPDNYVLVWKIEGKNNYPYVVIDAHTKQIYQSFDGIIVN